MYYDVNNVVDGNIIICMKIIEVGIFNFYNSVWWKVDFGRVYSIYSINILFKNYDGYGMQFCIYGVLIFVFVNDNLWILI